MSDFRLRTAKNRPSFLAKDVSVEKKEGKLINIVYLV